MRVVCDTGPVFHLIEASLLDLLLKAGEIHIPSTVDSELTDLLRQSWKQQKPQRITIEPLSPEENDNVESLTLSGLLKPRRSRRDPACEAAHAQTDQSDVTLDIPRHHDGSAQSFGQDVRIRQIGLLRTTLHPSTSARAAWSAA
jgi:hypothetical protein